VVSSAYHLSNKKRHVVADISVMLALMAGRNAKETMNVVEDNQVRVVFPTHLAF
jgi:hypothetical protein